LFLLRLSFLWALHCDFESVVEDEVEFVVTVDDGRQTMEVVLEFIEANDWGAAVNDIVVRFKSLDEFHQHVVRCSF
jgi:hypothetical protein